MKVAKINDKRKWSQHKGYKAAVMNAFDSLFPEERERRVVGKLQQLDTCPEVRRKAKSAL